MEDERREFTRVRERVMTFVKDPTTGKVHRALTKDLGISGICVATEETFNPGASLELELQMPDRQTPLVFTGEVVWSERIKDAKQQGFSAATCELGIKYVQIDPKDLLFMKQHIAMNAPPGV